MAQRFLRPGGRDLRTDGSWFAMRGLVGSLRSLHRRRAFGYDYFISYRQEDALAYADALAGALRSSGFVVFLDQQETPVGVTLMPAILTALRRSRFLIVIATKNLAQSPWMQEEIARFSARLDRTICINVADSLADPQLDMTPFQPLRDIAWTPESSAAVDAAAPSEQIVPKIIAAHRSLRVKTIERLVATAVLLAFAVASGTLVRQWQQVTAQGEQVIQEQLAKEAERKRAERQRAFAQFEQLTRDAMSSTLDAPRRLRAALDAYAAAPALDERSVMVAEHALRTAVLNGSGLRLTAPGDTDMRASGLLGPVALSPNVTSIVALGEDHQQRVVFTWRLSEAEGAVSAVTVGPYTSQDSVGGLLASAVSDDGLTVAVGSTVWRATAVGAPFVRRRVTQSNDTPLLITSNGRWLLLGGNLYDLASATPKPHPFFNGGAVRLGQGGRYFVSWTSEGPAPPVPPSFLSPLGSTDLDESAQKVYEVERAEYDRAPIVSTSVVVSVDGGQPSEVERWSERIANEHSLLAVSPGACWAAAWDRDFRPVVLLRQLPCASARGAHCAG